MICKMKSYEVTMGLVCWSSLFLQVPWGFISFGSTAMIEYDNYGIDQVGILLTSVAIAMVFGVLVIGEVGDKLNPKMLLTGGLLFCAGGAFLIVVVDDYYALLCGFILQGIGISVWRVVPYNQLTQIVPLEYYPRWYGWYEVCMSMLSAGGARMLMMISTVTFKSRWGWRLPWAFVCAWSIVNFFLLLFFAKFEKTKKPLKKMKKMQEHSYYDKFVEFIHNPIGICLFCSLACAGFGFLSLAAWAPYISVKKFKASYDKVQITMAIAATVAYPISVGGCAFLVYKTMGRIEAGLKYSIVFIIPAFIATIYVSMSTSFLSFVIPTVIFLALGFFPYSYYKVIPELLELPEDLTLFVLSYFSVAWTLFGEVLASVTITQIMSRYGIRAALYLVTIVVGFSAFFWLICSYWAFTNSGPILRIIEIRKAHTKQKAHSAWRHLRHAVMFVSRSKKQVAADKALKKQVEEDNATRTAAAAASSSALQVSSSKTANSAGVARLDKVVPQDDEEAEKSRKMKENKQVHINKNNNHGKDQKIIKKNITDEKEVEMKTMVVQDEEMGETSSSSVTTIMKNDEKEEEQNEVDLDENTESETTSTTVSSPNRHEIDDSIGRKVRKFKGAVYLVMLCNSFSHGVPHAMLGELEGIQKEQGIKI